MQNKPPPMIEVFEMMVREIEGKPESILSAGLTKEQAHKRAEEEALKHNLPLEIIKLIRTRVIAEIEEEKMVNAYKKFIRGKEKLNGEELRYVARAFEVLSRDEVKQIVDQVKAELLEIAARALSKLQHD